MTPNNSSGWFQFEGALHPIPLLEDTKHWINQPLFAHELIALRTCVNRQQPFGTPEWQQQCATALGLISTLRRRGRPSKEK